MMKTFGYGLSLVIAGSLAAAAGANSLVAPGPHPGIAQSKLSAAPAGEWNKLSHGGGPNIELWTLDGDSLNKISFYGGIAAGKPLFRETNAKRQPLPKVAATMLATDIPALLETSYRSQQLVNQMSIEGQEPALLAGHKAIRFTYSYTRAADDVRCKGEAIGALVDGKLYMVSYEAPGLHFFDKDIEKYRQLAETIKI